ncbi:MAG: L-seryl-tRNA(Sec) selenium transferase [Deltaproteobacteria bacterium]|nr:L-seryl-tRNA(Sec) selenium transferase [Deltaproteobacteria bacterium]
MGSQKKVNSDPRRSLPSVDRLTAQVRVSDPDLPEWAVIRTSRDVLETIRREISEGKSRFTGSSEDLVRLEREVSAAAGRLAAPHPRPVINATGVVLHTNLGRAPLAPAAAEAVARALDGYSNLELDLETGRRGSRMGSLEAKLLALSGAEAALVVNNNAAALLLALNTLALGREVVVSRGELVEIGGSFRVPAIMERAGVRLAEVGTTNRTHLHDYESAIRPETALLLKVHRSNFEQRGFVAEADVGEIAQVAHAHDLPFVEDLGSGTLLDLSSQGLPGEAFAPGRLALGVDVICFSGDKLLGGPQAGILMGKREHIEAMKKNPLARALRVDKLTVAALDATLDLMLDPSRAHEVPTISGLRSDTEALEPRVARVQEIVSRITAAHAESGVWKVRVAPTEAAVGGGSLPEHRIAGLAVVLEGGSAHALAEGLRAAPSPVLARVRDDALWLDVRTLRDGDLDRVGEALVDALASLGPAA